MVADHSKRLAHSEPASPCCDQLRQDVRTVPFGYRRNADGGLDSQPGEIEIVYEIATMRATGAKLADIAAYLTVSNVPTRRGGKWSAEQVRSILERAKTHRLPQLPASAA